MEESHVDIFEGRFPLVHEWFYAKKIQNNWAVRQYDGKNTYPFSRIFWGFEKQRREKQLEKGGLRLQGKGQESAVIELFVLSYDFPQ